jgi:uncharacterized membrane protein
MKAHNKHVLKAIGSNFELACVAAVIALLADLTWLSHDIFYNGFSIVYGIVGLGLIIGIVLTVIVIVRHNSKLTKKLDTTLLNLKLKRIRKINLTNKIYSL